MRPALQSIVDAIIAAHPDGLSLNELGEELLRKPVDYADIDEIIGALEEAGINLDNPAPQPRPEDLVRVLKAVRALTDETGGRPSVEEIAVRAGLTISAVRRALKLGGAGAA